ncbi:hypothetical protein AB0I61_17425 [Polymorphospora rubra]|uniref:hypothetical protein n=1 Tax=Polymorphospora rubra TaxID=338584 RepID=UPI0033C3F43F
MPHRRPVTVNSGRNPFEVGMLLASVGVGSVLAVTGHLPRSAGEVMPIPVQTVWLTLLICGGAIALAGIWWPGRLETGLRVEQAGVAMLGGGSGMYAVALIAVAGAQGIAAAGFVGAVALAGCWRALQILLDLRRVARAREVAPVPVLVEEDAGGRS